MKNKKIKKPLLLAFSFFSLSLVTFSVTGCGGVSSSITGNMVNKGHGDFFGSNYSLENQVKNALLDKTSSDEFKKTVANEVLYEWYYNIVYLKHGFSEQLDDYSKMKDNWDTWTTEAKDGYDSQVKTYKSDHGKNWPYYFQNEILDPIGADGEQINPTTNVRESAKETYIRHQLYGKIRSDFETRVFLTNYLSAPKDITSASSLEENYTNNFANKTYTNSHDTQYVDQNLTSKPGIWQYIDYYPYANEAYNGNNAKFLDWMYAYIQHVSFIEYTESVKPISTAMILWKGAETTNDTFQKYYNVNSETNPNGHVPSDGKIGYNFPVFKNDKFSQFTSVLDDGTGFFDLTNNSATGLNTNLINVPIAQSGSNWSFTDDGATLIKVNLGTDLFTSLDVTYAGVADELFNAFTHGSGIVGGLIPLYQNENDSVFPDNENILKNFLFSEGSGSMNQLPASFASTAQVLGQVYDEDGVLLTSQPSFVAQAGELSQVITQDSTSKLHAELFNHNSNWYKDGYTDIVSAFQLSDEDADPLPYVMIRERSGGTDATGGVHVIGLDGSGYLTASNSTSYPLNATTNASILSTTKSQERENEILKYRMLSSRWGDNRYSNSFDFTNGDLKSYFTTNEDLIILEIANQMQGVLYGNYDLDNEYEKLMDNISVPTGNIFLIPTNLTSLFNSLVHIVSIVNQINLYDAIVKNYGTSYDQIIAFNSSEQGNMKFGGMDGKTDDQSLYPTFDIYKNGLASKLPFIGEVPAVSIMSEINRTLFNCERDLTQPLLATGWTTATGGTDILISNMLNDAIFDGFNTKVGLVSKSNKGMAQYSEHIFTRLDCVNALLNAFGNSNNFTNNVVLQAYDKFLGNFTDGNFFNKSTSFFSDSNIGSSLQSVIASNIYMPKFIATQSDLTKLNNDPTGFYSTVNGNKSLSPLENMVTNAFEDSVSIDGAWGTAQTGLGFSGDKINYFKTLSTIKYLLSNGGTFSPKNFIDYELTKIKYGEKNVFAWETQDSMDYNGASFNVEGQNTLPSLYMWRDNYQNAFENRLNGLSNGIPNIASNFSLNDFVDNGSYFKYADAQFPSSKTYTMMGYKGLINSGSSLGDSENTALFNKFIEGNPNSLGASPTYTGALTQYGELGPFIDVANNLYYNGASMIPITTDDKNSIWFNSTLTGYIYMHANLSDIRSLSTTLDNSIPNFSDINEKMQDSLDIYDSSKQATPKMQAQGLISLISDPTISAANDSQYDAISSLHYTFNGSVVKLNNDFFSAITSPSELNNSSGHTGSASIFYDTAGSQSKASRVMFIQFKPTDLYATSASGFIKPFTDDDYNSVWSNLISTYGYSLIMNLVYQAAQDTTIINKTIGVVKSNFGKIDAYDRRFNDQLGYSWINNFKEKN